METPDQLLITLHNMKIIFHQRNMSNRLPQGNSLHKVICNSGIVLERSFKHYVEPIELNVI